MRDDGADRALDIALRDVAVVEGLLVEHLEHALGGIACVARTADGDLIAARIRHDAETALDQRQMLAVRPNHGGGRAVIVEGYDDVGLGLRREIGLAAGASEGESDALFGKGSGSHDGLRCGVRR